MNFSFAGGGVPASTVASVESAQPQGAIEPFLSQLGSPLRIQLIGLTGSGKTVQVGEFARYLFEETRQRTLLHVIDRGGLKAIDHLVKRNIVVPVYYPEDRDPFLWIDRAAKGFVPHSSGKWIPIPPELRIGAVAFDSATGMGEETKRRIQESQAGGAPIGPAAYKFTIREVIERGDGTEADEYSMTVGTTDKSHFGIMQDRIVGAMWQSMRLPYHLIWTANLRRVDQDDETKAPILGADLSGKALVGISPRWFNYTFYLSTKSVLNAANIHRLYIEAHLDQDMGVSQIVGNGRIPLAGSDKVPVPSFIEPASLVRALSVLTLRQVAAGEDIDAKVKLSSEDLDIVKRLGIG